MNTLTWLITGGFAKGRRTQVLGVTTALSAIALWAVGDMSFADLLGELPIARGAKVDDAKETKQVRKSKMSCSPTFPWSMIPEKRLPLSRIMLFLFEHDPCRDWFPLSGSCSFCLSMSFSENRFPLFRIMLSVHASFMRSPLGSGPTRITGLNHVAGVEIGRHCDPCRFRVDGGGTGRRSRTASTGARPGPSSRKTRCFPPMSFTRWCRSAPAVRWSIKPLRGGGRFVYKLVVLGPTGEVTNVTVDALTGQP